MQGTRPIHREGQGVGIRTRNGLDSAGSCCGVDWTPLLFHVHRRPTSARISAIPSSPTRRRPHPQAQPRVLSGLRHARRIRNKPTAIAQAQRAAASQSSRLSGMCSISTRIITPWRNTNTKTGQCPVLVLLGNYMFDYPIKMPKAPTTSVMAQKVSRSAKPIDMNWYLLDDGTLEAEYAHNTIPRQLRGCGER